MRKRIFLISLMILSAPSFSAQAELELVGEEGILISRKDNNWEAVLDGNLRLSYNHLSDVVTLGFDKKNDFQDYMGEQYSLGLDVKYKEEYEGYIKFASYGAARYDAPILPNTPVHTIYGDVDRYDAYDVLPRLEEWWISSPLGPVPAKAKAGLFKYSVGSGLALGGYYENYGASLSGGTDDLAWTCHFAMPDVENKWYLGPRVEEERERFNVKYNSRAYFFGGDVIAKVGDHSFQPYLGILLDRTPSAKRSSPYAAPVNTEYLGTYGGQAELNFGDLSISGESAANFGKAWSADPLYPSVDHQGWMFNVGASYPFFDGKVVPRGKFYYLSGNKFVGDDISDGQIIKGVNREFSTYSPLNANLADTYYPAFDKGPYVFAGMGNSLDQGILRANTFGDPYQMTNLITPNIGMDIKVTEKLTLNLDYWYLRSAEPGVGADYNDTTGTYSPYTLPVDLGNELDLYGEYAVNKNITLSLLAGLFLPGDYYRKRRADDDAIGISAAPRYDGSASNAWMIEAAVDYHF